MMMLYTQSGSSNNNNNSVDYDDDNNNNQEMQPATTAAAAASGVHEQDKDGELEEGEIRSSSSTTTHMRLGKELAQWRSAKRRLELTVFLVGKYHTVAAGSSSTTTTTTTTSSPRLDPHELFEDFCDWLRARDDGAALPTNLEMFAHNVLVCVETCTKFHLVLARAQQQQQESTTPSQEDTLIECRMYLSAHSKVYITNAYKPNNAKNERVFSDAGQVFLRADAVADQRARMGETIVPLPALPSAGAAAAAAAAPETKRQREEKKATKKKDEGGVTAAGAAVDRKRTRSDEDDAAAAAAAPAARLAPEKKRRTKKTDDASSSSTAELVRIKRERLKLEQDRFALERAIYDAEARERELDRADRRRFLQARLVAESEQRQLERDRLALDQARYTAQHELLSGVLTRMLNNGQQQDQGAADGAL